MRAYKFPEVDQPIYDCRDRDVIVVAAATPRWTPFAPPAAWARSQPLLSIAALKPKCPLAPRK